MIKASVDNDQIFPGKMTRRLEPHVMNGEGSHKAKVDGPEGPPREMITLIDVNAAKKKPLREQFTKRI